ncbi:MAG: hypothetical protein IKA76_02725 [Clostridia bacterium]|nr:hypothetical protein [Clostridia bacterium]
MKTKTITLEKTRQMIVFSMLGTIMFVSKIVMEALPNFHLVGALVMIYTLVYRTRALIPIYVYVFLTGLYGGFQVWWLPYLYIWTVLWGITMLLPKRMPMKIAIPVYVAVCTFHGLCYGILYAPAQAWFFGLSWKQTVAWIVAGFPFDVMHGIGNFIVGFLIYPLSTLLKKLENRTGRSDKIVKTNK